MSTDWIAYTRWANIADRFFEFDNTPAEIKIDTPDGMLLDRLSCLRPPIFLAQGIRKVDTCIPIHIYVIYIVCKYLSRKFFFTYLTFINSPRPTNVEHDSNETSSIIQNLLSSFLNWKSTHTTNIKANEWPEFITCEALIVELKLEPTVLFRRVKNRVLFLSFFNDIFFGKSIICDTAWRLIV